MLGAALLPFVFVSPLYQLYMAAILKPFAEYPGLFYFLTLCTLSFWRFPRAWARWVAGRQALLPVRMLHTIYEGLTRRQYWRS